MAPETSHERFPPQGSNPETLERANAIELALAPETASRLHDLLRSAPYRPEVMLVGEERTALIGEHEALLRERTALIERIDPMLREHGSSADAAAKERAVALLTSIVEAYALRLRKFELQRSLLAQRTADTIASALSLKQDDVPAIVAAIEFEVQNRGSANADLASRHEKLTKGRTGVLRGFAWVLSSAAKKETLPPGTLATIRKQWERFRDGKAAFDADLETAGVAEFCEIVGLQSPTLKEAHAFIDDITSELPKPERGKKEALESLKAQYKQLEVQRLELKAKLPSLLSFGAGSEHQKEQLSWFVTQYLLVRGNYMSSILGAPKQNDDWMMLGTMIVGQELVEEAAESIPYFGLKRLPFLRALMGPARLRFLLALRALQQQGYSETMLGSVVNMFARSPLTKVWNELFKVESAVTVLLWGMYVQNSPNKLQASIQFGSFIALSNAVGKVSGPVIEALGVLNIASRLRIPGVNFALQFAIALGAAFLLGNQIVEYSKWIDEAFPESALKNGTVGLLGLASGGPIVSGVANLSEATNTTALLDRFGLTGFDPDRDLLEYLGSEELRGGEWGSGREAEIDYRRTKSFRDWNARLEQKLSGQEEGMKKQLLQTLSIKPEAWAPRQALQLYSAVMQLRLAEEQLTKELHDAKVLPANQRLAGCAIATADKTFTYPDALGRVFPHVGDDTRNRNDRLLARYFNVSSALNFGNTTAMTEVAAYYAAMPEKDPRRIAWNNYVAGCTDVAKKVSIYRHLDMYSREDWLGDVSKLGQPGTTGLAAIPSFVQKGLKAEIQYQTDRRTLVSHEAYPHMTKTEYLRELVDTAKLKEEMSFLEAGLSRIMDNRKYVETESTAKDKRSQLLATVYRAYVVLNDKEFEKALKPLKDVILANKTLTYDDIAAIRDAMDTAVIARSVKREPLQAGPEEIRDDLGLRKDERLVFQGKAKLARFDYVQTWLDGKDPKNRQYHPLARSQHPECRSLHLARLEQAGDYQVFQYHGFGCNSSDRSKWKVYVQQGSFYADENNLGQRGIEFHFDPARMLTFETWRAENPEAASQLEDEFKRLQEQAKAREDLNEQKEKYHALQPRLAANIPVLAVGFSKGPSTIPEGYSYVGEQERETVARQRELLQLRDEIKKDGYLDAIFKALVAHEEVRKDGVRTREQIMREWDGIIWRMSLDATVHDETAYHRLTPQLERCVRYAELLRLHEMAVRKMASDPNVKEILHEQRDFVRAWGRDVVTDKEVAQAFRLREGVRAQRSEDLDMQKRTEGSDLYALYQLYSALDMKDPSGVRIEARDGVVDGKTGRQYLVTVTYETPYKGPLPAPSETVKRTVKIPGWKDAKGALHAGLPVHE